MYYTTIVIKVVIRIVGKYQAWRYWRNQVGQKDRELFVVLYYCKMIYK